MVASSPHSGCWPCWPRSSSCTACGPFVRELSLYWLWVLPISVATGLVLWTSIPYLLLNREVHWRRLLVAGGATALGTALLGLATTVYMAPLVTQYTAEFGLFGITIALIGWLLVASVVLVSCTAIGAEFDASQGPFIRMVKTRLRLHDPGNEPPLDEQTFVGAGLTRADVVMLVRVLANWMVMAAAVWVATALLPGIHVHGGFVTYLALSLLFGLVNAVVGPLLHLVALPLSVFTVGGVRPRGQRRPAAIDRGSQRPARCRGTGQRNDRVARHLDRHHDHRAGGPADPGAGRRSGSRVQLSEPDRTGQVAGASPSATDAPESEMAGGRVEGLGLPGRRSIAQAVVGSAQM